LRIRENNEPGKRMDNRKNKAGRENKKTDRI